MAALSGWDNLEGGALPLKVYEGEIVSLQFEGMHNEGRSFTLDLGDGATFTYSLMANEKADLKLYQAGRHVRLTFFEEVKKTDEVLEMLWRVEIGHD